MAITQNLNIIGDLTFIPTCNRSKTMGINMTSLPLFLETFLLDIGMWLWEFVFIPPQEQ